MVKVAAIGDNVVDCYIANGMMYPGGNTLNVAVFIRRFGGQSAYIGAIGEDAAGRHIAAALRHEGVGSSHLHVCAGTTAYCIIGHENAERVFLSFDLGVSRFTPSEKDFMHLAQFEAVHVGKSSGLDSHLSRIALQSLLSYDFATSREASHIANVAPFCFLAAASGGDLTESAARALQGSLLKGGAKWALVTRGTAGATLSNGREVFTAPAYPVRAVDTLGAGDTFIARTLYGLLSGEAPMEILTRAAECAAQTCLDFGAFGHPVPIAIESKISQLSEAGM